MWWLGWLGRLGNQFCKFSNYNGDYVIGFVSLAITMAIKHAVLKV